MWELLRLSDTLLTLAVLGVRGPANGLVGAALGLRSVRSLTKEVGIMDEAAAPPRHGADNVFAKCVLKACISFCMLMGSRAAAN